MAITATITLSDSTVTAQTRVVATCTVSNSGSDDVQVLSFLPLAYVSPSTYPAFVAAAWTGAPGGDFSGMTVEAPTDGRRGDGTIIVTVSGTPASGSVPQSGLVTVVSPAVTLTLAPQWLMGENATISASGGTLTVTNAGQPQFPSVSVLMDRRASAPDNSYTVPAGGSLALKFGVIPQSPGANGTQQAYAIGASLMTTGSVLTLATVSTLTVDPLEV